MKPTNEVDVRLKALAKRYEVVQLEFVRVDADNCWWSLSCKKKSTQRKWNISMGGWSSPLMVLRDAKEASE